MLIVRQGHTGPGFGGGTVAVQIPGAMTRSGELIADAIAQLYPQATVRVVINHCLAPEIIRVDKVEPEPIRQFVGALREALNAQPDESSALRVEAATLLKMPPKVAGAYSMSALRDLVKQVNPGLAGRMSMAIATNRGASDTCCFCAQTVLPTDYVNADDRPAHAACLEARRTPIVDDPLFVTMRVALETQPKAWHALIQHAMTDDQVRAATSLVLGGILGIL